MADDVTPDQERRIRASQTARVVVWVVLLGAIVVLALRNTQDVSVDWVFGDEEAPLFVVIVLSALLGGLVGAIAVWRKHS